VAEKRQRDVVREAVGLYPDLRERVVATFSRQGGKMDRYEQWLGYVPPETVNVGGAEKINTSPIRIALAEIAEEARQRYAADHGGVLPW
jgi:hypothetical protein